MNTWVTKPIRAAANRKFAIDLKAGDIWSLNEKSRRFAFVQRTADGIMATPLPTGEAVVIDVPLDAEVAAWEPEAQTPADEISRKFCLYDRVDLTNAKMAGTVVDINDSKFPDIDVIVLWDEPLHGNLISEVHPHEIEYVGKRALGGQFTLAKQAREFLRNMQDQHHRNFKQEIKEEIVSASVQAQQKRDLFKKDLDQRTQVLAAQVAEETIGALAPDLKRICEGGVMMITAGAYDYEVDTIPEYVNSYAEWIYNKVSNTVHANELRMPATVLIIKKLANSIMDSYGLTRQAYIRKEKGKYTVYSKKGKPMGSYDAKKDAVKRLRQIEYFKRHGADIPEEE